HRADGDLSKPVADTGASIRKRLASGEAPTDQANDFRGLRECAVIERIVRTHAGEILDEDAVGVKILFIRRGFGIDGAKARLVAPDVPRRGQRLVVARDKNREAG